MYIGSFWAQPLLVPDNRKLFEAEEQDLFLDIQSLPRNAALRKLNDLIKRARLAKVSALPSILARLSGYSHAKALNLTMNGWGNYTVELETN